MRHTKSIFVLLALSMLVGSVPVLAASDPGVPDTIRVDSVSSFVTGIGVVPITFANDESLGYVEVTLRQYADPVRIDSFTFVGGRLDDPIYTREVLINADSNIVAIAAIAFSSAIPAGNGLLGHLYLSYSQTITPQGVVLDSTTWMVGLRQHTTNFRTFEGNQTFKPQFIPGLLNIIEAPDTYDSVWVADVEAAPGTQVVVDVYGFNERNLAQIALALDYGSNNLILDSVSFLGTRCQTAPTKTVQPQPAVHKLYAVIEFSAAAPLPVGWGPIAALHFTVASGTPDGLIVVDSTTVGIVSNTRYMLTATDGSISFVPLFYGGSVTIKTPTAVEDDETEQILPTEYRLAQNYPNPFNPSTIIELSLPQSSRVEVEVFNILGRRVRTIVNRELPAGVHRLVFDGRSDAGSMLATGVYFYRVTTSRFQDTKKMLLIK